MQRAEAFGHADRAVDERDGPLDRLAQRVRRSDRAGKLLFQEPGIGGKSAAPFRDGLFPHEPQPFTDGEDIGRRRDLFQGRERPVENDRIARRAKRKSLLEMADAEASFFHVEGEGELAIFERHAIAIAQERHHELVVGSQPFPIDVEGMRMARKLAPFEHGSPPLIVGADADMVWHDIEDEMKPVPAQNVRKSTEPFFAAELWIDDGMIDDIIAVERTRPCLVDGRGIHMADAEACKVGHDGNCVLEGEALLELQTVGGAWRRLGKPSIKRSQWIGNQ